MLSFSSLTPGSSSGTAWPTSCLLGRLQLLLHLADERGVLVEQPAVLGADRRARPSSGRPAGRRGRSSGSPGPSSGRRAWRTSGTDRRSARSACSGRRRPCASRCRPGRAPSRRTPASRSACASPASFCRKFLISWSIEMPLAQPAACREPPWMLPGNSSMPVSRQPMPRMWLSPSPRTLSQTPCRISVRSWNGSSGVRLSLSVNSRPSSSGQKVVGHDAVGAEHDDQPLLAALPGWRSRGWAGSARTAGRRRRCPGRGGIRGGCVAGHVHAPVSWSRSVQAVCDLAAHELSLDSDGHSFSSRPVSAATATISTTSLRMLKFVLGKRLPQLAAASSGP